MKYCVTINNKRYEVDVERGSAAIVSTTEVAVGIAKNKKTTNSQSPTAAAAPKIIESSEPTIEVIGKDVIKAPMAGIIIDIKINVGSTVKRGDTLLLLEAMKMENEITAHVDGTVADIKVFKGTNVSADDVLVVLK
jgi:glutaconyl-CoA/methylmalonyl-CoA decarboxylase subunit gamma